MYKITYIHLYYQSSMKKIILRRKLKKQQHMNNKYWLGFFSDMHLGSHIGIKCFFMKKCNILLDCKLISVFKKKILNEFSYVYPGYYRYSIVYRF